ncbi:ABC transporter permease subunit [Microbispora sp. NPDC046933]|uniref:ABC transporter permease n=1 Tax=Microbispora sp. NPDC046933 TaxID=3155618 RepID=UPI0033CEBE68
MRTKSVVPRYARPPARRVAGLPAAGWTVVIVAVLLLGIEFYARSGAVSAVDLVPVTDMVRQAGELLGDREFLVGELVRTLLTIVASFALAAVIGVATAWAMVRLRWCRAALQPYFNVFYSIPTFALYPILVVFFGTGVVPVILLATAFSVVVIISHAVTGFDSVPPIARKLSASLRLTGGQHFRLVLMPSALPDILAGLKLGLAYTVIAVLASEFILAPHGLGRTIATAYNSFDTPVMYAGVLFVVAFALLANLVLGGVLSRFDWRRR